jgi:hypothetical protein
MHAVLKLRTNKAFLAGGGRLERYLMNIVIHPEQRRQGLGCVVMQALASLFCEAGATELVAGERDNKTPPFISLPFISSSLGFVHDENSLFEPFMYKNEHFTKTGLGV